MRSSNVHKSMSWVLMLMTLVSSGILRSCWAVAVGDSVKQTATEELQSLKGRYIRQDGIEGYEVEISPTIPSGAAAAASGPHSRFVPVYLSMPDSRYGPVRGPTVIPIILGDLILKGDNYEFRSSVTLVKDSKNGSCDIVVDTGISLYKNTIVGGLAAHGLRGTDIEHLVLTHRDLDSTGNINLFPHAQVYAGNKRVQGETFYEARAAAPEDVQFAPNRGDAIPSRALCDNTEIYLTPGYSETDLSLVVRNVKGYGTIAIVGNLILNQNSLRDFSDEDRFSSDQELKQIWQAIQREVLCIADFIIPGHGKTFRVTRLMKSLAKCKGSG